MSKKCFLICPIGKDGSEIRKNSDKLMRHIINPVCESKGYEIVRADQIKSTNKIDDDIIYYLNSADLAIADLTGCNPNVFYEIGYRAAKEKPTIYIARNDTELPFDINHIRTIFYDFDLDSAEKAKNDISETIDNLPSNNPSDSVVTRGEVEAIVEASHRRNSSVSDMFKMI